MLINIPKDGYIAHKSSIGVIDFLEYDLREYSPFISDSRYIFSPLNLITKIKINQLKAMKKNSFISSPLIFHWSGIVKKRSVPIIAIDTLFTIIIFFLFIAFYIPDLYYDIYESELTYLRSGNMILTLPGSPRENCGGINITEVFRDWLARNYRRKSFMSYIGRILSILKYLIVSAVFLLSIYRDISVTRKFNKETCLISYKQPYALTPYFWTFINVLLFLDIMCMEILGTLFSKFDATYIFIVDIFIVILCGLLITDVILHLSLFEPFDKPFQRIIRSIPIFTCMSSIYLICLLLLGIIFVKFMPCNNWKMYYPSDLFLSGAIAMFHLNLNIVDFPVQDFERIWPLQLCLVLILPMFVVNNIMTTMNEEIAIISSNSNLFQYLHSLQYHTIYDSFFFLSPVRFVSKIVFKIVPKNMFVYAKKRRIRHH